MPWGSCYPSFIPGPACSELVGALDSHPVSRLLWRRLKPLVLGKILFAPDTNFTRKLMAQVRRRNQRRDRGLHSALSQVASNSDEDSGEGLWGRGQDGDPAWNPRRRAGVVEH